MKKILIILVVLIIVLIPGILLLNYYFFQEPLYFLKSEIIIDRIDFQKDKDGDGINDLDDYIQGARKEIENKTKYRSAYYDGGYPPENEGVCTDVIWRALKNAGYDLKAAMDKDIAKNLKDYSAGVEKPDPNIDFRRVKNQLVFFRKYAESLTTEVIPYDKENLSQWQGGDIVVLREPEHIAIISDKRRKDGVPYIIHNAITVPKEENRLMHWYDEKVIIGHFRYYEK